MTSHKLVIKCGNYAVLVDVHVTPQDSNKDNVWFSEQKKEEVCMLIKDTIDSRVQQYLKARKRPGQWKQMEYAKATPFSLQAGDFHIEAYFVKRWVNLLCIWGQQSKELRVFPDRFVICVTRLESSPPPWKEPLSSGTSGYFEESAENGKCKISLTQQEKQDILKKIMKRTKAKKTNESRPQTSKDTMKVYLGSLCSDRE